MSLYSTLQRLKPWMLPIAMVCGVLFHSVIGAVQFLAPYLIFTMLLITFCKIKPAEFRISGLAWSVAGVQLLCSIAVFFCLKPLGIDLAEGTMICFLCPTATAAPVITAMLGGSISTVVAISLLSNLLLSIAGPAFLAYIGTGSGLDLPFGQALILILSKVGPMVIGPLAAALILRTLWPRAHKALATRQPLSFYIWAVSLILVVGRAVTFAMSEPPERVPEMLALSLLAGAACLAQFAIGRRLGRHFGDPIAGAQGLGQKNTVLAVWLATTYLNPISSIAPAAYIAWQNTINAIQIYFKSKHDKAAGD
ncbi:MAG: transporter [Muribaculaceae bacterium]|nr:transporter [Muribaculaceae bacterium]